MSPHLICFQVSIKIPLESASGSGRDSGWLKGMLVLAYRHIKWGLVSKLLQRAFSRHPQIPGTLKLDSISSLFKCASFGAMLQLASNDLVSISLRGGDGGTTGSSQHKSKQFVCSFSLSNSNYFVKRQQLTRYASNLHCILSYLYTICALSSCSKTFRKALANFSTYFLVP